MADKDFSEYALNVDRQAMADTGPAILGEGDYRYEVSGANWGNLPEGWYYKEATSVAINSSGQVYVFNRGSHQMLILDRDGNVDSWWSDASFGVPHGVTIGPDDSIFCVDVGDSTVRKFTGDGKLLMTLGTPHQPAGKMSGQPFCVPTHVAIDTRTAEFYVADGYSNARVHKYDPNGNYLFSWGESGTGDGQFNIVHNIDTDSNGWVYIADRENQRVQIFSPEGKYEAQWNNLSRVAALHIDSSGDEEVVYLGEYFCGIGSNDTGTDLGPRVTIMSLDGKVLGRAGRQSYGDETGRFYSPHGLAVDANGDVYVAEVSWSDYGSQMDPPRELRSMQKLVKLPSAV
jgi:sugar lactone lactonase YvrE